jgi:hypothetical protein
VATLQLVVPQPAVALQLTSLQARDNTTALLVDDTIWQHRWATLLYNDGGPN